MRRGATCLEFTLWHLAASLLRSTALAVHLEKLANVVLGCLEHLSLADVDVLEGVDALAGLLDLAADNLGNELLDELLEVTCGGLAGHDVEHLFADLGDLGRLGVGGLLDLVVSLLGESNSEEAEEVAVGRANVDVSFDESLPFSHQGAELVRGEVHAVELGQAVLALNILALCYDLQSMLDKAKGKRPGSEADLQLDFAERLLLVLVKIGEGDLVDTALESVVGVLCKIASDQDYCRKGAQGRVR